MESPISQNIKRNVLVIRLLTIVTILYLAYVYSEFSTKYINISHFTRTLNTFNFSQLYSYVYEKLANIIPVKIYYNKTGVLFLNNTSFIIIGNHNLYENIPLFKIFGWAFL